MYSVNGNKPKDKWTEADMLIFNKIKHKILDKAGEIGRLPENMYIPSAEEAASVSFWETLFKGKKGSNDGKGGTEV